MAVIASTVNAQMDSEVLDTFLIPSNERRLGGAKVIHFRMIRHLIQEERMLIFSSGKTYKLNDIASKQS